MLPDLSEPLDDKDEFALDDRDVFHSQIQRIYCRSREEAEKVSLQLKNADWEVTISNQETNSWSEKAKLKFANFFLVEAKR